MSVVVSCAKLHGWQSELLVRHGKHPCSAGYHGVAQSRCVCHAVLGEVPRGRDFRAQEARVSLPCFELLTRDFRRTRELHAAANDAGELEKWYCAGKNRPRVLSELLRHELAGEFERINA